MRLLRWERLKLNWEIGLQRLPAFTQRAAVLLLGVVVAAFVLIGLLDSVQRLPQQPYLRLSPSGETPAPHDPTPARRDAGTATTSTTLPPLRSSTPSNGAHPAGVSPPPTSPLPQPRSQGTTAPTTTRRPGAASTTTGSSTTSTSTGLPPVTLTLPLLQPALGG